MDAHFGGCLCRADFPEFALESLVVVAGLFEVRAQRLDFLWKTVSKGGG